MGKSKKNNNVELGIQLQAMMAQAAASNEANRIAAENVAQQRELTNINKNMSADLTAENRAVVEVAGAANDADALGNDDQKRKRAGGGLATTLGIS